MSGTIGKWLARRPVANPENSNSAIEQFTYVGDIYDDLLRAKLSLFSTMVSDPLFDELRTKQQLGYIVSRTFASLSALRATNGKCSPLLRCPPAPASRSRSWVSVSLCSRSEMRPTSSRGSTPSGTSSARNWPR